MKYEKHCQFRVKIETTMNLYLFSLFVHITGISVAAGTTFVSFLVNRRFWQAYGTNRVKALTLVELSSRFPRITGLGIGLLLLSGIYIMYLTKGAFGEQLWFRIKMVLVILVIIINIVINILEKRVKGMVTAEVNAAGLQRKVTSYYLVQLFLFLTIFVLGVFKFN
jgi:uncharacterized membrane protein SirB2